MSNNKSNELAEPVPGILTNQEYLLATAVIGGIVLVIASMGIITNCLNIRLFIFMGVKDGVTVGFISLACTDLLTSCSAFGMFVVTSMILHQITLEIRYSVDLYAVAFFLSNISLAVSTCTVLTTMYIAAARCMCVLKPLQFRTSFTRSRSIVTVVCINVFSVGIYTPLFALTGTMAKFDPAFNETRIVHWVSLDRERVKDGIFMLIKTVLPLVAQILLIVCVSVMSRALAKSSQFRHAKVGHSKEEEGGQPTAGVKLAGKERQAVQQVVLISAVFIVCNIPTILVSFLSMAIPGLDGLVGVDRFWRMYIISHYVQRGFEQLNSSLNFIFYYLYNTKYRTSLKAICGTKTS